MLFLNVLLRFRKFFKKATRLIFQQSHLDKSRGQLPRVFFRNLVHQTRQTFLSYLSPGKFTFCLKRSTAVPIKGFDGKRQIIATFTFSVAVFFQPIQLIYKGKTEISLPKYKFWKRNFTLLTQRTTGQFSRNKSIYSKWWYSYICEWKK